MQSGLVCDEMVAHGACGVVTTSAPIFSSTNLVLASGADLLDAKCQCCVGLCMWYWEKL